MTKLLHSLHPDKPIDVYAYSLDKIEKIEKKYSLKKMNIPKLSKIVISTSLGVVDKSYFKIAGEAIANISCQKPMISKAKKSVSSFKVREGMDTGYYVTLRKRMMYNFINRLVYITLPRVRDFKGLSKKSFDANFNYNIGIKDCSAFHEVDIMKLGRGFGLNIAFHLKNIDSTEKGVDLLRAVLLPIR